MKKLALGSALIVSATPVFAAPFDFSTFTDAADTAIASAAYLAGIGVALMLAMVVWRTTRGRS